jgi:hypothetical protein
MHKRIPSNILQLLVIILVSLIFGALGFLYSFVGFLDQTPIISLEPFRGLTIEEIGGHFLFGFIVGIAFKNVKISILIGLMAVTIDADHLLSATGFDIQGRIDHSIPFAILSSILMSLITSKIYYKISRANLIILPQPLAPLSSTPSSAPLVSSSSNNNKPKKNTEEKRKSKNSVNRPFVKEGNVFSLSLFLFITLAAFLSHIAYDVIVDDNAMFPLLAPFSYSQFVIPRIYGLPIEAAGFIFLFLIYHLFIFFYGNDKRFSYQKNQYIDY